MKKGCRDSLLPGVREETSYPQIPNKSVEEGKNYPSSGGFLSGQTLGLVPP